MSEFERKEIIKELEGLVKFITCPEYVQKALSLIKELTEERKDFEIRALRAENEAAKYKDRYETEKQAHEMLSESYDHLEKTKDDLLAERSRLTEENERLRDKLERTDRALIVMDKAHNKLFTESFKIEADTVRKMQDRFNKVFGGMDATQVLLRRTFDQIAKEMLEGKDENT